MQTHTTLNPMHMIILELKESELNIFNEQTSNGMLKFDVIGSKKLGGDEIIFQLLITSVSIASPYIVNYFRSLSNEDSHITLIKDGVKIIFENEEDLKKFLDNNS